MADIEITCASCSKTLKVSQFVDRSSLVCPFCKKKAQAETPGGGTAAAEGPAAPDAAKKERRLKLKEREELPTPTMFKSPEQIAEEEAAAKKAGRKGGKKAGEAEEKPRSDVCTAEVKEREQREPLFTPYRVSWLVGFVLCAAGYYLRYGSPYAELITKNADLCAWIIVGLNVVILTVAAKDSIFQSILGLLIPGYAFYWLFLVSDCFFLRAIFAGILVAVGQDGGLVIKDVLGGWFEAVNNFIQSGGG